MNIETATEEPPTETSLLENFLINYISFLSFDQKSIFLTLFFQPEKKSDKRLCQSELFTI